jgi:signal transduction histidine kinase
MKLDLAVPIAGDPDKLIQLIDNLVTNAIRHGDGTIAVRAYGEGTEAVLTVHNGGTPIAPEAVATLFDPFKRASGGEGGVGLGLFIVQHIARAHGGSVAVTSSADGGTTFSVRLPL